MGRRATKSTTPEKRRSDRKRRFLEDLAEGHTVSHAAKAVGVDRTTAYLWRHQDLEFAEAWEEAVTAAGDWYEDRLHDKAESGDTTAIIVGLKMHRRFVERQEHTGDGGGPILHDHVVSERLLAKLEWLANPEALTSESERRELSD